MSMIYREAYREYLEDTIIPDLIESGMMQTAKDFFIAEYFMADGTDKISEETIIKLMCERYDLTKEDFA